VRTAIAAIGIYVLFSSLVGLGAGAMSDDYAEGFIYGFVAVGALAITFGGIAFLIQWAAA
jgi:hypothetical protein